MLLLLIGMGAHAQKKKADQGLWQTWQEVTHLAASTNKPVFIDIYTDWCRYCKIMDATTFKNDSVVSYLKQNYLRFKFNAEGKDTIMWNNKAFTFNPRYDVHDFAVYLTRGSIVYPTTVIITPGGQPFYKHGEISAGEMEMLLKYFAMKKPSQTLEEYAAGFAATWK